MLTAENSSDLNPRLISNLDWASEIMKGTTYNGSHFATKGTSRSEGESMFSVGNLVAFSYSHYCSPDGRSSSRGCCPSGNDYLLQEEVTLEEYNNTTSDRYGSGNNDTKSIVELNDLFWHEYSTQLQYKTFLLQVLESNNNVFTDSFIVGDITEVRNNPGKYLHIYEVPENYREYKDVTFQTTVEKINLQKKQEDDFSTEKVEKSYRGVDLVFGITSSGWYASRASFSKHSVQPQHEHDSTSRSHYKLVIMPCVPNGGYTFYLPGGTPMSLHIGDGEPSIDTLTDTHWANSQSWKYCKIEDLNIQEGWIFIDGEDVFDGTKEKVQVNKTERRTARNSKFEEAKAKASEFHNEKVINLALRQKGKVIATLIALGNTMGMKEEPQVVIQAMEVAGKSQQGFGGVFANLLAIIAAEVIPSKAGKIAEKAGAWKYIQDCFPKVSFTGYFDEASEALAIYSKEWAGKVLVQSVEDTEESDLAIKLRKALNSKK
jgi:hypothetical protein